MLPQTEKKDLISANLISYSKDCPCYNLAYTFIPFYLQVPL